MIECVLPRILDVVPLQQTFYPLGFPVCISTNSDALLRIARAEWGVWRPVFDEQPIQLRIEVSERPARPLPPAEFQGHRHLFAFVADAENLVLCDTQARTGTGSVSTNAIENAAYFRYHFLEGMAWMFIESLYLTPIHATCVTHSGRGVLLCGDSGAGKSTLAYACARRGWTYVTDDASYLIRRNTAEQVVIGNCHRIRLRPEAARIFPELRAHRPIVRGNGKSSLELWTRDLESIVTAPSARVDRMIFSKRSPGSPARLAAFGKLEARAWCEQVIFKWNPDVAADQSANLTTLLEACEIQALEYSDFDAAVEILEKT